MPIDQDSSPNVPADFLAEGLENVRAWRDSSPTYRTLKLNVESSLQRASLATVQSLEGIKRGIAQAQQSSHDARDALIETLRIQLRVARSNLKRATESLQPKQPSAGRSTEQATDMQRLLRESSTPGDSQRFAIGALVFGGLLFTAGAAPWALPFLYVLFIACAVPWRAWDFSKKKGTFFLLDFCYWANAATVLFLVLAPHNQQLEAIVYAMADGPLAGALIVWQSSWVFSSASHSISVLIHLLPGLAVWAHRHFPAPLEVHAAAAKAAHTVGWTSFGAPAVQQPKQQAPSWLLMLAAPLMFYAVWQALYWVIVQVLLGSYIKSHGFHTSYSSLAQRAKKANNIWSRLVLQGRPARRVCLFGLLQLVFTLGCLCLVIPVYKSFTLSLIWQFLKVVFPIWHGARYQCEKKTKHALQRVLKQCDVTLKADQLQTAATAPCGLPAPSSLVTSK